jgi:hypothetical protein
MRTSAQAYHVRGHASSRPSPDTIHSIDSQLRFRIAPAILLGTEVGQSFEPLMPDTKRMRAAGAAAK